MSLCHLFFRPSRRRTVLAVLFCGGVLLAPSAALASVTSLTFSSAGPLVTLKDTSANTSSGGLRGQGPGFGVQGISTDGGGVGVWGQGTGGKGGTCGLDG